LQEDSPFSEPVETKDESLDDKPTDEPSNCCSGECEEPPKSNVMLITKCPHTHRKHYAKNMCSSCYRKFGRNQNAFNCEHTDRLLYSMGMCQTCYLSDYHKRRTKVKRKAMQMKAKEEKNRKMAEEVQSEQRSAGSEINLQI
jgi:hypothetical protein